MTVRTGPRTVYMCIMYLVALLHPDCIYLYFLSVCTIVPGQFMIVVLELMIVFLYVSH